MHQQLEDYLQKNLPNYLDFLQEMVSINSFTANAVGVNALGDLTAERFADLGFKGLPVYIFREFLNLEYAGIY